MKRVSIACSVLLMAAPALAQAEPAPTDLTGAFRAAGFTLHGHDWHKCDDPGTASYSPGHAEQVGDLNGDGLPEVLITEGSAYCYGNTGTAFSLVSKQTDGWKLMIESTGMANILSTKGVGGWPDIEIGGPGFCYAVSRWNGSAYKIVRYQYEGRACRP